MAVPRRDPVLTIHLVEAISDKEVREMVIAVGTGTERSRDVAVIDFSGWLSQLAQIGVKCIALVTKHHDSLTLRATERI